MSRRLSRPWPDGAIAAPVAAVLAVAYARTIAPGLTWANLGADGGDLITAAATLGVAHPTGYPTYLLLARLFQLLPFGDLAFRTNLLSASAAAGAALLVYAIVRDSVRDPGWTSALAAGIAALACGLSPLLWSQAVIAEVYTLNALFVGMTLWFTRRAIADPARLSRPWPARLEPLLVGLGLGNHVTAVVPAIGYLVATVLVSSAERRWRMALGRLGWLALGLMVYIYLPLRASAHPPVNWGGADTWEGFWWQVSGQPYRLLAFGLPRSFLQGRVEAWAGLLVRQFGWLGIGLGFVGLFYGGGRVKGFIPLTAALAAAYSIFAIAYTTADSHTYLIPFYLVFAVWIGLGAWVLLDRAKRWRRASGVSLAALLLAGTLWPAPRVAKEVDARTDRRAVEFADAVLQSAPIGAAIFTAKGEDTFSLWYFHYALGQRPDLFVVVEPLLEFGWYRENLREVHPGLNVPEARTDGWETTLLDANATLPAICRTDVEGRPPIACDFR